MKMNCLILGIFLINSIVNMPVNNTMIINKEQNFTDLKMGQKYYLTISASSKIKYAFKMKISSSELSSPTTFSLSYIGYNSKITSSYKEEGNLTFSFSTDNSYNTYESSSCNVKYYSINFITFILTSKYDIGSASIMISEANSGISYGILFLIVFSSLMTLSFLVLATIAFIKKGCIIIDPQNGNSPQPENYTSLTSPQNQQPQPQNTDLQQNENGSIPDQLQIN